MAALGEPRAGGASDVERTTLKGYRTRDSIGGSGRPTRPVGHQRSRGSPSVGHANHWPVSLMSAIAKQFLEPSLTASPLPNFFRRPEMVVDVRREGRVGMVASLGVGLASTG